MIMPLSSLGREVFGDFLVNVMEEVVSNKQTNKKTVFTNMAAEAFKHTHVRLNFEVHD